MGSFNGNHTTPLGEYYDPTLGAFVTYDPSTVQPDAVAYFAKRAPAVICDRCGTTPAPHRLTNFGTRQRLQLCAACAAGPDWDDTPTDAPGGDDDDTGPYEITGRLTPAECATVTGWLTGWAAARTPDERINADIPVLDEGRAAHPTPKAAASPEPTRAHARAAAYLTRAAQARARWSELDAQAVPRFAVRQRGRTVCYVRRIVRKWQMEQAVEVQPC